MYQVFVPDSTFYGNYVTERWTNLKIDVEDKGTSRMRGLPHFNLQTIPIARGEFRGIVWYTLQPMKPQPIFTPL